jgi:uncharacterized protein YjiS (DUF1127 family)
MDAKLPPPLIVMPRQDRTALMPFGECVGAVDHADTTPLQGSVPTWAGVLRTQIGDGLRMIGRWILRPTRRDALADLNDHLLRDIGVSPVDARSACAKPRISHEGWVLRQPPRSW